MQKVKVRCTLEIEVEVSEDLDRDEILVMIEDNGCPGTGPVWAALSKKIDQENELGVCWACNLSGQNTVLEIGQKKK